MERISRAPRTAELSVAAPEPPRAVRVPPPRPPVLRPLRRAGARPWLAGSLAAAVCGAVSLPACMSGTDSSGRGGHAGFATGGQTSSGAGGEGGAAAAGHGGGGPAGASGGSAGSDGEGGSAGAAGAGGRATGGGAGGGAGSGAGGQVGVAGSGGASSGRGDAGGAGGSGVVGVVGATPPMGWNSWNTFRCNITESLIKGIADVVVSSGMKEAGYQYVNLDDCWMDGRDSSGKLRWNTTKFPAGIPALADYIHGKGLKLGIYEVPNSTTCVGIYSGVSPSVAVGSLGHETTDAQTFASWGVDFLKYDLCKGQRGGFAVMRDALRATGRPIFYGINPGNTSSDLCPPNRCSVDLPTIANMWRITTDISGSWSSVLKMVDADAQLWSYAGPGHWNDPDMMEVGNGLSDTEGRAHFSMWAMLAAPLIAGNDLRSMSAATEATLTNSEVIAVDQDARGIQGRKVATPATDLEVWSKPLSGTNVRAVALLNRGGATASITVQWSALGIPTGAAAVRDLWSHTDAGMFTGSYTASLPSHGVVMLKVTSAQ